MSDLRAGTCGDHDAHRLVRSDGELALHAIGRVTGRGAGRQDLMGVELYDTLAGWCERAERELDD